MILLDAAITGTPAATAAVSQQVELSLWDLCLKGGPLMIVLTPPGMCRTRISGVQGRR